jgi:hypothetical protein
MNYLRGMGLKVGIVERWVPNPKLPGGGLRMDLFNVVDLIGIGVDGVIGVQSCGSDFAAHKRKITEEYAQDTRDWLLAPGTKFWLIGWTKKKRRLQDGSWSTALYWTPRVEEITLDDLD